MEPLARDEKIPAKHNITKIIKTDLILDSNIGVSTAVNLTVPSIIEKTIVTIPILNDCPIILIDERVEAAVLYKEFLTEDITAFELGDENKA